MNESFCYKPTTVLGSSLNIGILKVSLIIQRSRKLNKFAKLHVHVIVNLIPFARESLWFLVSVICSPSGVQIMIMTWKPIRITEYKLVSTELEFNIDSQIL